MWRETSSVAREGQDKLARYHQEVSHAKMLSHTPLRSRLAQTLRGWAERLEPTPLPSRVDKLPTKRAH